MGGLAAGCTARLKFTYQWLLSSDRVSADFARREGEALGHAWPIATICEQVCTPLGLQMPSWLQVGMLVCTCKHAVSSPVSAVEASGKPACHKQRSWRSCVAGWPIGSTCHDQDAD